MELIEPSATWLLGRESDVTSQFGEDGLIAAILERIGTANRWCFEVGASDGEFYSNTKRLRDDGWDALLIEGNADQYAKLTVIQSDRVRCVHYHVGPDHLDGLLDACSAPVNLDFGVIDIDGQDWWVFDGLRRHRPRLIMVEFANGDVDAPIPLLGEASGQAGYKAILSLGLSKGYKPICQTQVNLIFVADEVWH